jgi:hypothetical protein
MPVESKEMPETVPAEKPDAETMQKRISAIKESWEHVRELALDSEAGSVKEAGKTLRSIAVIDQVMQFADFRFEDLNEG